MQINLGCGGYPLQGWANYDIEPHPGVIQRDLSQGLAYPENSVQRIFSEHFLEHLAKPAAVRLLGDCHRALVPGGAICIVMPDARAVCAMYLRSSPDELRQIGLYDANDGSFCDFLNQAFRAWGHQYLWDEAELRRQMEALGYRDVRVVARDASAFPGYRNVSTDLRMEAVK